VAAGATVVDSVLLPGASVGSGATVERSLVMGAVGSGAVVRDSMVGAEGSVGDGESLIDGTAPAVPS
jgi:ADP-glucose pyrophosphorylase